MQKMVLQVNMGSKVEPIWNNLNGYDFDPNAIRRSWSKADNSYIECAASALQMARTAIGSWSMYHRYLNRQFRVIKRNYMNEFTVVLSSAHAEG